MLTDLLAGKAWSLQAYGLGSDELVASGAKGDRKPSLLFRSDGVVYAWTGVNLLRTHDNGPEGTPDGKYYVGDQRLQLCGAWGNTHARSTNELLNQQDQLMLEMIRSAPVVQLVGDTLTLSLEGAGRLVFSSPLPVESSTGGGTGTGH